jgi:hypothetical protein
MEDDGRITRRGVLVGAGGLAAAGAVAPRASAAAVRRLGEPHAGRSAAEVVGRIAQSGNTLTGYGFLTHLAGVDDDALFTGSPHAAGTARITFFATATVGERFPVGVLVSVTGDGSLALHVDGGGADFAAPESFAHGRRIARFGARFQHVATVFAPNQAISHLEGDLVQHGGRAFALAGRRSRIGHHGLRLRLSTSGQGMRTQPTPPQAVFDVAGRFDVVR